jgi:hypothetical protein
MKERVKLDYEGRFTDHVTRYDELSAFFHKRAAIAQLEEIDFHGKDVIDIGCGEWHHSFKSHTTVDQCFAEL